MSRQEIPPMPKSIKLLKMVSQFSSLGSDFSVFFFTPLRNLVDLTVTFLPLLLGEELCSILLLALLGAAVEMG